MHLIRILNRKFRSSKRLSRAPWPAKKSLQSLFINEFEKSHVLLLEKINVKVHSPTWGHFSASIRASCAPSNWQIKRTPFKLLRATCRTDDFTVKRTFTLFRVTEFGEQWPRKPSIVFWFGASTWCNGFCFSLIDRQMGLMEISTANDRNWTKACVTLSFFLSPNLGQQISMRLCMRQSVQIAAMAWSEY